MFDTADPEEVQRKQVKLFEQKKKMRFLESDKKSYIDESVKVIKKQKTIIEKVKKENESLKELIFKMNKGKNQNIQNVVDVQLMQQKLLQINSEIKSEKEAQKVFQNHINNFQRKIKQNKIKCQGANSGAENENNMQKQVKILENRLDKANQKYNETTANNKQLKASIDNLRRERIIFDNLFHKLQKELDVKRKKMANVIEKANNAYEERDKALYQIQSLKTQAKKEANDFEREIQQMSYLNQKIKLSFYNKRVTHKNLSRHTSNFFQTDPMIVEENKIAVKQINPQLRPLKNNDEEIKKIQKYRQDFAKIEAATEIENFDELLRIFSENENKNFQMFTFVNLQSNQIQELEAEIDQINKEFQNQKEGEETINSKNELINNLQQNLESIKKKFDEVKKKFQQNQHEIRPLSINIERIFETIQCDRELAKQIGGNKAITQNNFLIFLSIIEHKASQIVKNFKQYSNSMMVVEKKTQNKQTLGILALDDFEDNEEYNKILTADQLKEKAKQFIEKEQIQKQKKKEIRNKKNK